MPSKPPLHVINDKEHIFCCELNQFSSVGVMIDFLPPGTPPRGPVRFSQPEPPSQRRRCLPKRAEKKSNVRRGKTRSVPVIPIHLDEKEEDDSQVQSSNKSETFKSNINIR